MPFLEDKTPWWATLLMWLAGAGIVLGLLGGAMYLGLGQVIKPALGWLGAMLPRPQTRKLASRDVQALVTYRQRHAQPPTDLVRRIERQRTRSPTYDRLFQRQAKTQGLSGPPPPPPPPPPLTPSGKEDP